MRVLGKNIGIRVTKDASRVTNGGLYLAPGTDDVSILRGTIEYYGESVFGLAIGDVVHFSKFNSSKISSLSDSQSKGDMYIVSMEYVLLVE